MKKIILLSIMVLAIAACCPSSKTKAIGQKAPDWIQGTSSISGRLCAVGISGATMVQGDAVKVSDEKCMIELAKHIKTFIVSASYDKSVTNGKGMYLTNTYVSTTEEITDAVVKNVEVIDHYFDKPGAYSGGQESTYALCCMPEGSAGK